MTDMELGQDEVKGLEAAVQDAFTRAFTNFKGTVHYSCKRSRGKYSDSDAEELGFHIQFDYAPDASGEEFLAVVTDNIVKAKGAVYMGLGRDVERDINGIPMDANTDSFLNAFPGAVIETREEVTPDPRDDRHEASASTTVTVGPKPPYSKKDLDALAKGSDELKAARNENTAWAKARYETHPGEFWDNRVGKKYENSPDFAHKDKEWPAGFWVD